MNTLENQFIMLIQKRSDTSLGNSDTALAKFDTSLSKSGSSLRLFDAP
jgi:hypothetical protein